MVKYAALKGLYELDKTIGQGGFAKVKLATHIATGEKVAIKIMDKAKFGPDLVRVKLEVKAMKSLIHPHICKLYQVMETDTHFFMVMEYCSGGELFDRIVEQNRLTESESQKFFRQIVSAVAHLHSLGYAHRDLKPENVLLDKEQNLKLIDFGLCAKPKGGMQSHLSTSCGSPSYAAPELILGKQYLGAEADVWSMGVLLFTLLTGYLPFGDDSIECLYKKILSGKYVEPEWLSPSSKKLVRQMLQVDPAKRITIAELCYHPWVIGDSFSPIVCKKTTSIEQDEDALKILSAVSSETNETVWKQILNSDRTDYQTATYMLLLDRKRRGLSLRISSVSKPRIRQNNAELKSVTTGVQNFITTLDQSPGGKSHKKVPDRNNPNVSKNLDLKDVPDTCTPGRKRSRAADEENMLSPIPHKKPNVKPKQASTPTSNLRTQDSTPGSARKVMMGLERGINRVKDCLTPKRRIKVENAAPDQPNKLSGKNLCNVSSTSSDCPKHVLAQLRRALQHKGIVCRQKGFVLRGETEAINSENTKNPVLSSSSSRNSCKFELEVCLVEGVTDDKPLVGIRRKRLKGDAWVYKRVCEEVLALAAEDITTVQTNPDSKCLI